MRQDHYIQGSGVNPPKNYNDVTISVNFEPNDTEITLSSTDYEWINENKELLLSLFQAGTSGGNGLLEGIPHQIVIRENGSSLIAFQGFINLATAEWDRNSVSAKSSPLGSIDWINDVADSFDFETLYDEGLLTDSDKVFVPYVINSIPNYKDIMIATLTLTFISTELESISFGVGEDAAKTPTLIDSISGVIGLIFKILFAIALLVTVVKLILDLINLIIQRVKYVAGMNVNTMIRAACTKIGYTFQSPILEASPFDKLHIIPEASAPPITQVDERIKGFLTGNVVEQNGYYNGTFGDLIRGLQEMFDLRIVADNNTLKLLSRQKSLNTASFQLPRYDVRKWRTNADRLIANNVLSFQVDQVDGNTIDQWEGTNVQSVLSPISQTDKRMNLLKSVRKIQIPFARAYRKNDLTGVEKVVDSLLNVLGSVLGALIKVANALVSGLNAVIDAINSIIDKLSNIGIDIPFELPTIEKLTDPRIQDAIDNRIGMLLLEKDMIGVPKICLLDVNSDELKTKISTDNDTIIRASYLWNNYYKDSSFAPTSTTAQRYIYDFENVEMNLSDVQNVINEGVVKLPINLGGNIAEVVSCEWNASTRLANFVVKVRKIYTNNLTEKVNEPSGR